MKRFLNDPGNYVTEMLDGLVKAHPDQLGRGDDPFAIVRADAPANGKIGRAHV